ncbi:MAG: phage N-6-adenine-methyltransferase [Planctomycetota bacterium]|nr:phage N-6-adenine-methyltransferase [Planctomycetota bacterium]
MYTHQKNSPSSNVEWLMPPALIAALGEFDLDPCTPAVMPWRTPKYRYTLDDDGLSCPWFGRIWLNPPFGPHAAKWLDKLRRHGNGVALIPARTETRMFFSSVWGHADGLCFIKGRVRFHYPDGRRSASCINAPVCLVAYGSRNLAALHGCGLGVVVSAGKPVRRREGRP